MIVFLDESRIKRMADFVSAGITNEPESFWVCVSAYADSQSITIWINGTARYEAYCGARVIKGGYAWVNARVFCELAGKVKSDYPSVKIMLSEPGDYLSISGEGYGYVLPTADRVASTSDVGRMDGFHKILVEQLVSVCQNMKVIKEAESDVDLPVCEIVSGDRVEFVSFTRNRSVCTWIEQEDGMASSLSAFVAIEHLQKMDKAIKQVLKDDAKATVEIRLFRSCVAFSFSDRSITLRRVEKDKSAIHKLIDYCRKEDNQLVTFKVSGKDLKEAYSRLDAFGKRNESSIHRVDFVLQDNALRMKAMSQAGSGSETIIVADKWVNQKANPNHAFAAAGNKLADLLRISGYQTVKMSVLPSSIMLEWDNEKTGNLAILAGLRV